MMIDIMITILFCVVFYNLSVNLDRDIHEYYDVDKELYK